MMTLPAFLGLLVFFVSFLLSHCYAAAFKDMTSRPHIIFVLADDLGWNDVSFHGSPQIPTPNLDAFAYDGVILNNNYAQPTCTPSRASLMTGLYAIHTGLQGAPIKSSKPIGLPLHFKIMPQWLKQLGYSTHMIGKWHLGFFKKEYTPTYRGFDSHYGLWTGGADYFDHSSGQEVNFWGYDLRRNMDPIRNETGHYSTQLFTEKACEVIYNHNKTNPLFLYFAHQAPHAGNNYNTLQAPSKYILPFEHINNARRKRYAGMVAALDDSFGQLMKALQETDMLQNSIIIFSSDNGGAITNKHYDNESSNWPLRGAKGTLFEGGIRVASFVWSSLFKVPGGRVSQKLMHISDWLPTLYEAAGGDISELEHLDGISMWKVLSEDFASPRTEMLVNIDLQEGTETLRQGDYKLVSGFSYLLGKSIGNWSGDSGRNNSITYYRPMYDLCQAAKVLKEFRKGSLPDDWTCPEDGHFLIAQDQNWNRRARRSEIICSSKPHGACNPEKSPCLYNVSQDPCEHIDIANQQPEVVEKMIQRLNEYKQNVVPELNQPEDPDSSPLKHNFLWVAWRDCE